MAADKEQAYVKSLQDFSKALGTLVAAMKQQIAENKVSSKNSDKIKKEATYITKLTEDVSLIKKTVTTTKNDTAEILSIVQSIKQQKKDGFFDKLSPKDKTKSIGDSIKTVALMAGSLLAIGVAFKVIGQVNFKSVIAMAIAMPLLAVAFDTAGKSVQSPKRSLMIGFSMIIMAGAVAVSSHLLKSIPTLSIGQIFSAVGVGVAMGLTTYIVAEAVDRMGIKKIANIYAVAPVLPLIAAGIVLSGAILKSMPIITMQQVLSTAGVGLALGAAMIPLAFAAKLIGNKDVKDLYLLTPIMPLLAGAIYASAMILQNMPTIDMFKTITSTIGISVSVAVFGLAIFALNKLGLSPTTALKGIVVTTLLSVGILVTSQILALGKYDKYPDWKWALGVGLSLGVFGLAAVLLGGLMTSPTFYLGLLAPPLLALSIVATSYLLGMGKYDKHPSLEWAAAVGMSMLSFGAAAVILGLTFPLLLIGIPATMLLAYSITKVADIFNSGKFDKHPSLGWALGVGGVMVGYGMATIGLGALMLTGIGALALGAGIIASLGIARAIVEISNILGSGDYSKFPSLDWSKGVGMSLLTFSAVMSAMSGGVLGMAGGVIGGIAGALGINTGLTMEQKITNLLSLARAMTDVSRIVSSGDYSKFPTRDWVTGVDDFMRKFASMTMMDVSDAQQKKIVKLTSTYMLLAKSIQMIANALKGFQKAPNLSGIYGGIVTLGLVDTIRLKDTLDTLDNKNEQWKRVMSMLNTTTNIDESTFDFPKKGPGTGTGANLNGGSGTGANSRIKTAVVPNTSNPTLTNFDTTQLGQMSPQELKQLVSLMQQMNSLLSDIADNTANISGNDGMDLLSH